MGNATSDGEVPLTCPGSGTQQSKARMRDGVVLGPAGPWSRSVQLLLRHQEQAGFTGAPRVVGSGFVEDGRETLTFVPGEVPQPYAWSDDGVAVSVSSLVTSTPRLRAFVSLETLSGVRGSVESCQGRRRSADIATPARGTSWRVTGSLSP
jgi:hypothetical protein